MTPYLYLAAAAAIFSAGLGAGWKARDVGADADVAKLKADHAAVIGAWDKAALESSEAQRALEQRRIAAASKEAEDARQDAQQDAARAAGLAAANRRLLDHVARLAAYADRPRSDPPAAVSSAPAAGPGMVLAQLYRGADAEATELAASYDAARRAGLTCERVYESLIVINH